MLTPIDTGNVCVNVDTAWFEKKKLDPPATLDDLTEPAYRGLFVTPGATSSTPGMAFLLATIAQYGDDWTGYWEDLVANDAKVVSGWEDAYNVDFTFSGGDRPIVLSYDSSPAFTVKGEPPAPPRWRTPASSRWSTPVSSKGPRTPKVPRRSSTGCSVPRCKKPSPTACTSTRSTTTAELPTDWAKFAPALDSTLSVDAEEISSERQAWQEKWRDIVSR